MTLRNGLFVSGPAGGITQPQDARLTLAGLLSGPGLLTGYAVTGTTSGPNMQYSIAAGVAVTQRGTLAADGLYTLPNDGPLLANSGAPAPSSGKRWDLIWVRHKNGFDGGFTDTDSNPDWGVVVGTSGSTPTKPYSSVPAGALVIAESDVGTSIANASLATITQVAAPVVAQGGILPVANSALYPAAPIPGEAVFDIALKQVLVWDGASWRPYLPTVTRQMTRTTGFTLSSGDNFITAYSGTVFNYGNIGYSGGIFTTAAAGPYRWDATVTIPSFSGTGRCSIKAFVNGAAVVDGEHDVAAGGVALAVSPGGPVLLAAGDTVQLCINASGTAIGLGITANRFSLTRMA